MKLWNINNGCCIRTFNGHSYTVWKVQQLSKNMIVSVSYDKTIKFWQLDKSECIKTIQDDTQVYDVRIMKNGNIITSGEDKKLKIWGI